ncbi:ATP-binding protein [Bdellovibrionota bacterium FG-1]
MKLLEFSTSVSFESWASNDRHLLDLANSNFHWQWPRFSELLERLSSERGGVHILRGPRQVGKTTFLKSIITTFLRQDNFTEVPTALIQGDWIEDYRELDQVLRSWLESVKKKKGIVLIDEVTYIREWQRAVKGWIDEGLGGKVHFLITGSNSFDLRRHAELLPGRRGCGLDLELLPMSFFDFYQWVAPSAGLLGRPDAAFELYLKIGGFPHAAREFLDHGITTEAQSTYLNWIRGDVLKSGKNDALLRELFSAILQTATTPVGLDDLREKSSFGSHNTVRDYLDLANDLYILTEYPLITPGKWTLSARKNRKYYFRDPLISWIARNWSDAPISEERFRAFGFEGVMAEWVARKGQKTGYLRDRHQHEVDFVSRTLAIEVKSGSPHSLGLLSDWKHSAIERYLLHGGPSPAEVRETPAGKVLVEPIWNFLLR